MKNLLFGAMLVCLFGCAPGHHQALSKGSARPFLFKDARGAYHVNDNGYVRHATSEDMKNYSEGSSATGGAAGKPGNGLSAGEALGLGLLEILGGALGPGEQPAGP